MNPDRLRSFRAALPRRFGLVGGLVCVLAGAFPAVAAAQRPVRLRLGTLAPQGTSYHRILLSMGERWRSATNGQVQLTVYAGTMGSEIELVRRMRLGQLQVATLTETGLREIEPAIAALQEMPMMFRSIEEAEYVRGRLAPELARRLADRGFVVLFWGDAGWVHFFSRRSAVRPDDFRSMKMFVTAGQTEQFDLMRAAGYTPVSLEWSDALTGLQTGIIDAVPTIPYFALTMQLHTVATHMLDIDWAPVVGATIITKRAWDGLTPAQQTAMRQAAVEAGREFQERGRIESDEAVAAMRSRGLTVDHLSPADLAAWRAATEQLYPRIRGSLVPADMYDEVVRLLAQYRARSR